MWINASFCCSNFEIATWNSAFYCIRAPVLLHFLIDCEETLVKKL